MNPFSERDVRRCYDLLQHDPDVGLTQLKAMDSGRIIGLGLFDNEDDFTSECERYNTHGDLYVGVNPRSPELLDQFSGLTNRMRSVFSDVTEGTEVEHITGIVVPGGVQLATAARALSRDASVLHDQQLFFALDPSVEARCRNSVAQWAATSSWDYDINQHILVPGTALPNGGFFSRRVTFKRYRPYGLSEVSEAILAMSDSP